MGHRILIMTNLEDLLDEVKNHVPLRLNLIESSTNGNHGITNVTVSLCLQGINLQEDIMWMQESYTAARVGNSWLSEGSKQIFDLYRDAHYMLKAHLEAEGFDVRSGRYGIPNDILPVNCRFPLWDFRKDDDGTFHLVPVEQS